MAIRTSFTDDEAHELSRQALVPHLLALVPAIVGIVCLALQWPSDHLAVMIPATLGTAYGMLSYTSCLHEAVHQTLFRRSRLNVAVGRVIGAIIFVPYTSYRETHIRHHAYLNTPDDWELWPYATPGASLPTSAVVYGRIFFHSRSPQQAREIRQAIWYEYTLSVGFWTAVLGIVFPLG